MFSVVGCWFGGVGLVEGLGLTAQGFRLLGLSTPVGDLGSSTENPLQAHLWLVEGFRVLGFRASGNTHSAPPQTRL